MNGAVALVTATPAGLGTGPVSGISWGRWAGPSPQAVISGAFTGATGQGAAMTYGFNNGGTVTNGVAAFHR